MRNSTLRATTSTRTSNASPTATRRSAGFTIGRDETVSATDRDTLVSFVRGHYEPSRIVVGLAGRVDDGLAGAVESQFGDLEGSRAPDPEPAPAPSRRRVLLEYEADRPGAPVRRDALVPHGHPDRYVVHLLSTVLGGGMSSRLSEELTMRRGLAYSDLHGQPQPQRRRPHVGAGRRNADKVDEAITAIIDELRRVADEPVGQDELDKARNFAKGRFVFGTETPQGIISHALRGEVLEGGAREPAEVLAAVDAVTADDLQRVAQDLLSRGLYLSLIGPYDDAARFERLVAS